MSVEPIVKARTQLLLKQPFFGALALRLKLVKDNSIPTAATDGKTLMYNEKFVNALDPEELKFLVAHEVCHCMFLHHLRRNNRDPTKWNIAADFVINNLLIEAGFRMPKGGLANKGFENFSTDHVYNILPTMDIDLTQADHGGLGEVQDGVGGDGKPLDEADGKKEEAEWKVAISQAANAAKQMGRLPANLERLVGNLVDSKVDWAAVLREFVKATAKGDYTWSRPNRRFIGQGMYFPTMHSESIGEMVVAVDTSGSIGQKELDQFASEITAIMEDVSPTNVTVIYCDTEVAHTETFTKEDMPLVLNAKGGGGTDFRPPFEWVEKKGLEPACFIYLTDMYCNSFPSPPPYPTLWVSISHLNEAPFGQVVEMQL